MAARVLDGTRIANEIREEVRPAVQAFTQRVGRPPGLGIVLVGDDPASAIYVRNKLKSAGESGLRADLQQLFGALEPQFLRHQGDHVRLADRLVRGNRQGPIGVSLALTFVRDELLARHGGNRCQDATVGNSPSGKLVNQSAAVGFK